MFIITNFSSSNSQSGSGNQKPDPNNFKQPLHKSTPIFEALETTKNGGHLLPVGSKGYNKLEKRVVKRKIIFVDRFEANKDTAARATIVLERFLQDLVQDLEKGVDPICVKKVYLGGGGVKEVLTRKKGIKLNDLDLFIVLDDNQGDSKHTFRKVFDVVEKCLRNYEEDSEKENKDTSKDGNDQITYESEYKLVGQHFGERLREQRNYLYRWFKNYGQVNNKEISLAFFNSDKIDLTFIRYHNARRYIFYGDSFTINLNPFVKKNDDPKGVLVESKARNFQQALSALEGGQIETDEPEKIDGKRAFFELTRRATWGGRASTGLCDVLVKTLIETCGGDAQAFTSHLSSYSKDHLSKYRNSFPLFLLNLITAVSQSSRELSLSGFFDAGISELLGRKLEWKQCDKNLKGEMYSKRLIILAQLWSSTAGIMRKERIDSHSSIPKLEGNASIHWVTFSGETIGNPAPTPFRSSPCLLSSPRAPDMNSCCHSASDFVLSKKGRRNC